MKESFRLSGALFAEHSLICVGCIIVLNVEAGGIYVTSVECLKSTETKNSHLSNSSDKNYEKLEWERKDYDNGALNFLRFLNWKIGRYIYSKIGNPLRFLLEFLAHGHKSWSLRVRIINIFCEQVYLLLRTKGDIQWYRQGNCELLQHTRIATTALA